MGWRAVARRFQSRTGPRNEPDFTPHLLLASLVASAIARHVRAVCDNPLNQFRLAINFDINSSAPLCRPMRSPINNRVSLKIEQFLQRFDFGATVRTEVSIDSNSGLDRQFTFPVRCGRETPLSFHRFPNVHPKIIDIRFEDFRRQRTAIRWPNHPKNQPSRPYER